MKSFQINLLAVVLLAALALPAQADIPASTASPAASSDAPVQWLWNARLRDESVDDAGFAKNARADTLRLRLGLLGNFGGGWSGLLEAAGVASADNHYNSGANGQTQYPGITDPHGSELNQAWLRWQNQQFTATIGRQDLPLDNQRWVGNSGWRQFEQTYDAVALAWRPAADWTVRYDWIYRVHRVSGPDAINPLARSRSLDASLFNVAYAHGAQTWVGYAYLHKDRDVSAASTATYGLRWVGNYVEHGSGAGWTAEFARQSDYADNPANYTTNYWLLEPSWTSSGVTAKLGWEHLGGNGLQALQTPLATLHAFNGWDDQFNVTPAGGLNDRYAALVGKFDPDFMQPLIWNISYHDFHAATNSHYGTEWDASVSFALGAGVQALVKVADYRADGFGHDDTRLWLQIEWSGKRGL